MMVNENIFVAFSTCAESPRAVRYSNPAYKPIATEVMETNHANQLTRLVIVCTMLVVEASVETHDMLELMDDDPTISATSPTIFGESISSITPAITYNNVFFAAMAFCGICPPIINKNPTTSMPRAFATSMA